MVRVECSTELIECELAVEVDLYAPLLFSPADSLLPSKSFQGLNPSPATPPAFLPCRLSRLLSPPLATRASLVNPSCLALIFSVQHLNSFKY